MDFQPRSSSEASDLSEDSDATAFPEPPEKQLGKRGIGRLGWIILGIIALGSLLALGILPRLNRRAELQAAAKAAKDTLPAVNVTNAHRANPSSNLVLPGSVIALNQTTIYARTTGYLQRWLVDIGDRVQQGQILAEIDSPETDQQVDQAKADLAKSQAGFQQARADLAKAQANVSQYNAELAKANSDLKQAKVNLELARQTWKRWQELVRQGAVTQQDADTKEANYNANQANVESAQNTINSAEANVSAAKANVSSANANVAASLASIGSSQANLRRYQVLQSFEKVQAPFTGIVVARNIDSGALITSGSSNNNTSLYTIAAYDKLSVNVSVPQALVSSIQVGQAAQVTVRELPQRVFNSRVIRTTNAIDANSRTLLTQLAVENPNGELRPGMYATVNFTISRENPPLMVPGSALVNNGDGTQLAVVTQDQKIHYQKVELGRDYGKEVEINSGLTGNEQVVTNPTVDLTEGAKVQPKLLQQGKSNN